MAVSMVTSCTHVPLRNKHSRWICPWVCGVGHWSPEKEGVEAPDGSRPALSAESPGEAGLSHHLPCSDTPLLGGFSPLPNSFLHMVLSAFSNFKKDELEI